MKRETEIKILKVWLWSMLVVFFAGMAYFTINSLNKGISVGYSIAWGFVMGLFCDALLGYICSVIYTVFTKEGRAEYERKQAIKWIKKHEKRVGGWWWDPSSGKIRYD